MKQLSKILTLIFISLIVVHSFALAQPTNTPPQPDDEFGVALLLMAIVFMCAVVGAAIIGAALVTLLAIAFFALVSAGILSTSVAVGLYKRSFGAGFRSLLILIFSGTCGVIGLVALLITNHFFPLHLQGWQVALAGGCCGVIGGYVMAIASYHLSQKAVKNMLQKFAAA